MHLPVIWGNPELQGLDIGIFIGLAAAVVFWAIMHRSTLGYEVRAVGHNPDAARGAGISVARNYILTMAICGAFAGLAASVDVLGWQFQVSSADIQTSQVGFLGIAVALLGRNTAIGTVFAALLFGALSTGTAADNLNLTSINPELAPQLTLIIEGLVVLLVSTDLIAIRLLGLPRRLGLGRPGADLGDALSPTTRRSMPPRRCDRSRDDDDRRLRRRRWTRASSELIKRVGIVAVVVAAIAWILTLPPIMARTPVPSIVLGITAALFGARRCVDPKHRRLGGVDDRRRTDRDPAGARDDQPVLRQRARGVHLVGA